MQIALQISLLLLVVVDVVNSNNPLHGVKLETILNTLVEYYGWDELGKKINIRCFNYDPSVKSSLKFLRKVEHEWARVKVENLYIALKENKN